MLMTISMEHLQTEAVKPVLGKYYRNPKKSGPLPVHLLGDIARSLREDHYVSDNGDIVYYQTDPDISEDQGDRSR